MLDRCGDHHVEPTGGGREQAPVRHEAQGFESASDEDAGTDEQPSAQDGGDRHTAEGEQVRSVDVRTDEHARQAEEDEVESGRQEDAAEGDRGGTRRQHRQDDPAADEASPRGEPGCELCCAEGQDRRRDAHVPLLLPTPAADPRGSGGTVVSVRRSVDEVPSVPRCEGVTWPIRSCG